MFRRKREQRDPEFRDDPVTAWERFEKVRQNHRIHCLLNRILYKPNDFEFRDAELEVSAISGYNRFYKAEFSLMPTSGERKIYFDSHSMAPPFSVDVYLEAEEFERLSVFLRKKPFNSVVVAEFSYENSPPQPQDDYVLERKSSGASFRLIEDIADPRYHHAPERLIP